MAMYALHQQPVGGDAAVLEREIRVLCRGRYGFGPSERQSSVGEHEFERSGPPAAIANSDK